MSALANLVFNKLNYVHCCVWLSVSSTDSVVRVSSVIRLTPREANTPISTCDVPLSGEKMTPRKVQKEEVVSANRNLNFTQSESCYRFMFMTGTSRTSVSG